MSAGSHARALAKHQRGMAIQILTGCPDAVTFHDVGPDGVTITAPRLLRMERGIPEHAILAMLDGRGTFDVARVRAYARELIALELEQAVFTDWTMELGKGPDNPLAFARRVGVWTVRIDDVRPGVWTVRGDRDVECAASPDDDAAVIAMNLGSAWGSRPIHSDRATFSVFSECPVSVSAPGCATVTETSHFWMDRGGWPGRFAKAWGTVQCAACNGRRGAMVPDCKNAAYNGLGCVGAWHSSQCFDTWVWCKPCDGTGRTPKHCTDRRAPMGRSLARMGQRLIDALDWQPGECQADDCERGHRTYNAYGDTHRDECPDCHGTGHNLRGMLPPVEITPAMMSSLTDEWLSTRFSDFPQWTEACRITRFDVETWSLSHLTRVVHRGDHLHRGVRDPDHDLDRRISERLWDVWGDDWHEVPLPTGVHGPRKRVRKHPEPSWRRGLRVHAQQRRDRAAE